MNERVHPHARRSQTALAAPTSSSHPFGHSAGTAFLGELTRCADSGTPRRYLVAARVATEAASEFTMEAGTGVPTLNESTSASIKGPVIKATLT